MADTPATSVADLLDQKIIEAGLNLSDDGKGPEQPLTPVVTPATLAEAEKKSGFTIPESITAKLTGKEAAPAAPKEGETKADDFEAREKQLDELFKTKSGQAFQELKTELKQVRAKVSELTTQNNSKVQELAAQLEEARKTAANPAEVQTVKAQLEELKKINTEYEKELALVKVEATREYQQTVKARFDNVESSVTAIAKKYENVGAADLLAAIKETDGAKQDAKLTELASGLHERDRLELYSLVKEYQTAVTQRETVKQNAKDALQLLESRRQEELAKVTEAEKTHYTKGLDEAWNETAQAFPFLQPIEGQDEWNQTVSKAVDFARSIDHGKLTPRDKAQLTVQGAILPLVAEVLKHFATEAETWKQKAIAFENATPGAGGGIGGGTKPGAATPTIQPNAGFLEAFESAAAAIGR